MALLEEELPAAGVLLAAVAVDEDAGLEDDAEVAEAGLLDVDATGVVEAVSFFLLLVSFIVSSLFLFMADT